MTDDIQVGEAMALVGMTKSELAGGPKSLNNEQVRDIRNRYWVIGANIKDLSIMHNVSKDTIKKVINRKGAYKD